MYQPCGIVETVECWQLALESKDNPSVLALTRQNLPQLRQGYDEHNRCAAGAYELIAADDDDAVVSLFASSRFGSGDCGRGRKTPRRPQGLGAGRVGACFELLLAAPAARRASVIGEAKVNVAVEAGIRQGWDAIIGSNGAFVGMTGSWRQRTVQGFLPTFRNHARKGGRGGTDTIRKSHRNVVTRGSRAHPSLTRLRRDNVRRVSGLEGRPGMSVRVAINGFGRIGRNILRAIVEADRDDIEVVAVNDLAPVETNAHLLRYDSIHGRFPGEVTVKDGAIYCGNGAIKVTAIRDPATLPWKELGVDIALECTGIFTSKDKASAHLKAGAKRVLISAPADGVDLTVVYGVNHDKLTKEHLVVSNASCTTNCLAPVAKVLNDAVGIDKGFMTTIHSYTNDQPSLDQVHKDLYRARAAASNMIPTSTGAAKAKIWCRQICRKTRTAYRSACRRRMSR